MSDRFYQQQTGRTMGALAEPVRKVVPVSKAQMVSIIGIEGIEGLLVIDLQKLLVTNFDVALEMPDGRLKAPYIKECKRLNDDVNWSKLTIESLKNVIYSLP